MNYVAPKFEEKAFTCPYCGTYAQQNWEINGLNKWSDTFCTVSNGAGYSNPNYNFDELDKLSISTCQKCNKYHIWHNDKMIVPTNSPIPMPLEDMPEVVKELYIEARDVYPVSYKSACALLRLAV